MKVLHILYQSLPQLSGSSIRSRDILLSQKEIGIEAIAITPPFQSFKNNKKEDSINGVSYFRTGDKKEMENFGKQKSIFKKITRFLSIIPFTLGVLKLIKKEKPDILHAHAMFYCAIPAIILGKIYKIPTVYEFRSLWMYDVNEAKRNSFTANLWFKLEAYLLQKADFVVFLNKNLKDYFIKNGYTFANSEVIDNAINTTYIRQMKQKPTSVSRKDNNVFGYIGTITSYEGIGFLIQCFQELYDEGFPLELIIYGNGDEVENIIELINNRADIKTIKYKGSILPEDVYEAYNEIDTIVNPRLKSKITDSVTPLKPLEALAYEKLFIGSSVNGILEIIDQNKTGFIFNADDKENCKEIIKSITEMPEEQINKIKKTALNYVESNKSWLQNAQKYMYIYTHLISK